MTPTASEQSEILRSAQDAAHRTEPITKDFSQIVRYLAPPEDTRFPLEYAFHLLGPLRGLTVLDYGCGAGENLVHIAVRAPDIVVGLDISPELIELAKKRAEAYQVKAHFLIGSAYKTGMPSASIDVVFAIAIFHHLDLAAAVKELRRIVRPGGFVILQEPVRDFKFYSWLAGHLPYDRGDVSPGEAPLTLAQLDRLCDGFRCEVRRRFNLPFVPLVRRLFPSLLGWAQRFDGWLLKKFPSLGKYATIEVRKMVRTG